MTISDSEGVQEVIDSTPQHPFYVEGKGWVEASALHAGMTIWFANGTKGYRRGYLQRGPGRTRHRL